MSKADEREANHTEATKAGDYNDAVINLCYYGMS